MYCLHIYFSSFSSFMVLFKNSLTKTSPITGKLKICDGSMPILKTFSIKPIVTLFFKDSAFLLSISV